MKKRTLRFEIIPNKQSKSLAEALQNKEQNPTIDGISSILSSKKDETQQLTEHIREHLGRIKLETDKIQFGFCDEEGWTLEGEKWLTSFGIEVDLNEATADELESLLKGLEGDSEWDKSEKNLIHTIKQSDAYRIVALRQSVDDEPILPTAEQPLKENEKADKRQNVSDALCELSGLVEERREQEQSEREKHSRELGHKRKLRRGFVASDKKKQEAQEAGTSLQRGETWVRKAEKRTQPDTTDKDYIMRELEKEFLGGGKEKGEDEG